MTVPAQISIVPSMESHTQKGVKHINKITPTKMRKACDHTAQNTIPAKQAITPPQQINTGLYIIRFDEKNVTNRQNLCDKRKAAGYG